ncbi:hypothetical protein DF027_21240 [Burkholderia cenocepacia]|uniref:hypothetical protein n=1 Tax=Burkholderia cenocepacia TaxID=95486 RepID=UPI000F5609B5|nr:hypothetical protein [Burkholderia cenocepacia]RQV39115.1 hypothetical protein DF027_21240 [Burkholderia cenocepacia]RQV41181.1 hypothetical protein DF028_14135 [Burkholderia cenocepacia]RQV78037.1 hypothetical protein DF010_14540 [Burkholderia cenocepacia]
MEGLKALDFGKQPTGEGGDTYRKAAIKIQANFDAISAEIDRKAYSVDSGAALGQERQDRATGDANTLASAKSYADTQDAAKLGTAKAYADTVGSATLTSAKAYADYVGSVWGGDAKAYADVQDKKVTSAANARMDSGDANTLASSKSYTDDKIAGLIGGAPETLNTLKELADALGDDKDYAAHVTAELGLKAYTTDVDAKDASILAKAKAYTDSSPAGSASKPYVDSQDAATLASSKAYTDSLAKGVIKPSGVQSAGQVVGTGSVSAIVATNGSGSGQTSFIMKREGGPTDQKQWECMHDGNGAWVLRTVNDNYSNAQAALQVTRATGVTVATMLLMPTQGNVVAGPIADDGQARLQVGGKVGLRTDYAEIRMRAASGTNLNGWRIISNINGAQDGSLVFQHSTDNYGTNFTDALTLGARGNVFIATEAPPAGPSALNIGNAMLLYSPQYDNIGMFSTSSYSGGLAIEAASGDNKTKKNIALAPWGGRVLIGPGVGDDGASALRVQGQAAINGNAIVGGNLTAGANIVGTTQYRQGLEGDGSAVALYNDPGKRNFVVRSGPSTAYKFTQVTEAGDLLSPGGGYFTTVVNVPQLLAEGSTDLATASLFLNNKSANGRKFSVAARNGGDFAISDETAGAMRLVINPAGTVVAKGNVQVDGSHNVSGDTNANQINATGVKLTGSNLVGVQMWNTAAASSFSAYVGPGGYYNLAKTGGDGSVIGAVMRVSGDMQQIDILPGNNAPHDTRSNITLGSSASVAGRLHMYQGDPNTGNFGELWLKRASDNTGMYVRGWPDTGNAGVQFINAGYTAAVASIDNSGTLWLGNQLTFANGSTLQGNGNLLSTYRNRWLSDDLAKMDDAWNKANDAQVNRADRGAQCQHSANGNEFASINVGYANQTADTGNPWVLTGMRSQNGSNVTYLRCGWLRNN